jgi:hypothetical protein
MIALAVSGMLPFELIPIAVATSEKKTRGTEDPTVGSTIGRSNSRQISLIVVLL